MKRYYYDDIGNRDYIQELNPAQRQYTANNLNQYTNVVGTTYVYDADGNLENDGTWIYTWNAENQLVGMRTCHSDPWTLEANDQWLIFAYDYMGRRYSKEIYQYNGSSWVGTQSHSFIYDGWNLIHEKIVDSSTSSTDTRSYVWGLDLSQTLQGAGGVGGLLCSVNKPQGGSAMAFYAMADANGNITDYAEGRRVRSEY